MKLSRGIMRRFPAVILLSLIAFSGLSLSADRLTARQAFMLMPDSIIDLLPASTRKTMVDSFRTDTSYKATNALGGLSQLVRLDSTYALIRLTSVSDIQIKILPRGKSDCIVGMSYTVNSPEADSELFFFNSMMQPLPTRKILKTPEMRAYFKPVSKPEMNEIDAAIPFPTASYSFSPDNTALTATLTSVKTLPREKRDSMQSLLRPPLTFNWLSGKYHLVQR